jgi:hypothetical protein
MIYLLDKSSLFALLVRMHYPDLVNLCKVQNYLYEITTTPWFQQEWKKYNIKMIVEEKDSELRHSECDRLGNWHGLTTIYGYDYERTSDITPVKVRERDRVF